MGHHLVSPCFLIKSPHLHSLNPLGPSVPTPGYRTTVLRTAPELQSLDEEARNGEEAGSGYQVVTILMGDNYVITMVIAIIPNFCSPEWESSSDSWPWYMGNLDPKHVCVRTKPATWARTTTRFVGSGLPKLPLPHHLRNQVTDVRKWEQQGSQVVKSNHLKWRICFWLPDELSQS